MKTVNGKVLVSCNLKQKEKITIGGLTLRCANNYNTNYRERSPVVCATVDKQEALIVHHNTLYTPSPFHLYDNVFSIPANGKVLFAKLNEDLSLEPMMGNFFCERIDIPSDFPLPPEYVKQYTDRVRVTNPGKTQYKSGQLLFTRPYSYYEIVYIINETEKRVVKCHEDMVVGYLSDK